MEEYKLSEETAKAQSKVLLDFYGLDEKEITAKESYETLLRGIRLGRVDISLDKDNRLRIEQTLQHPPKRLPGPLYYKVCDAKAKAYAVKDGGDNVYGNMLKLVAYLTASEPSDIGDLFGLDLRITQSIVNVVFLA